MQSTDLRELLTLRPAAEYHEDMGNVLWWVLPLTEPPYVGKPTDCGHTVELHYPEQGEVRINRVFVGGWPGYHTHWSPIPMVVTPGAA